MVAPFRGPKLKVGRAKRHIEDLDAALASYRAARPFTLTLGRDGDLDTYTVAARPLPEDVPLVIGDAVHNLRTALGLLACDLVRRKGKSRSGVYFPFCEDEGGFDAAVYGDPQNRRRPRNQFRKAGPDAVEMARRLRPWEGPLRALHDLDVTDKHQMILPALAFLRGSNFGMHFAPGTVEMSMSASGLPTPESVAAVEDLLNASVRFVFQRATDVGLPPAAAGQVERREIDIVPTLHEFAELVERIVQTFEAHRP